MGNLSADGSPIFEPPRDIVARACETIADSLRPAGYKFAASSHCCRRDVGDFSFQIAFHSSHHNVAGRYVNLDVTGTVFSPKLKKWCNAHPPLRDWPVVAGGNIGRLRDKPKYLEWDLADPGKRVEVIDDVIESIKVLALPYFSRFEDIRSSISFLVDHELPAMGIFRVLEFLLCFADVNTARKAANRFLREHPELLEEFHRNVQAYPIVGPDRVPDEDAKCLAYASVFFGLGKLTGAPD